jgi:uncharacterized protein YqgC (DUF456 family)
MVSAEHFAIFVVIATLSATPTYYVLRRTGEGRARSAIAYLIGLAVGIAAAALLPHADSPTLESGLLAAFVGPFVGMARAGYMRRRRERDKARKARMRLDGVAH